MDRTGDSQSSDTGSYPAGPTKVMVNVTKDSFDQEVLQADKPVLVDFWAPWCGPCRAAGPVIEQLAGERTDVKFVKINTDEEAELSDRFKIRGIPAFILFKDGKEVDTKVGFGGKGMITDFLDAHLK